MAPPLLSLTQVTVTFGGRPLFEGIDLALGRGDKVCLIGRNGSGKSTLMKILAGLAEPDGGERFVQPGIRVGHLAQEPDFSRFATVFEAVTSGLPPGEEAAAHRVDAVLDRLGLDPARDPGQLSGGEARRTALAGTLVGNPDVLLLDEPTNHLDLPTIEWLEQTLLGWRGALLLISHDRAFLSALSRRTLWLDRGRLRETARGFADFETWQQEVFEADEAAAHKLDRKIATETKWLREGISARRTRNMGRVRALQDLRRDRSDRVRGGAQVRMAAAESEGGGRLVIEAEHLSKAFPAADGGPPTVAVRDFSTRILRGDRVGVIGPNGAGKSTLLKLLTGRMAPDGGTVRLGTHLSPVYFDQKRAALDPDASIARTLLPAGGDTITVGGRPRHVASYMKDFLFDPGMMEQPTRSLSGGERNRLLLATLFARPSNLMILDEPTNDLDIDTLDLLEEVLSDYDGTLLLVSHDRDFLDRLVTSVIAVEGGGEVQEYVGGYSDAESHRKAAAEARAARPLSMARGGQAVATPGRGAVETAAPRARRALTYQQQRELDGLPARLEKLTADVARLEAALGDPALFSRDPGGFTRLSGDLAAAQAALAAAEDRWLELEALRESAARPAG